MFSRESHANGTIHKLTSKNARTHTLKYGNLHAVSWAQIKRITQAQATIKNELIEEPLLHTCSNNSNACQLI